jgi:hypothetical protein
MFLLPDTLQCRLRLSYNKKGGHKGYNPEVDYNYSSGGSNSTQPANLAPGKIIIILY